MAENTASFYQLNRGLVSKLALARMDIKRTAMSAEVQTNFVPRVLGSMMLRPGLEWIGAINTEFLNNPAVFIPFVFSTDDTALIEITNTAVRFWIDDELLIRPDVETVMVNQGFFTDFTADLTWTATAGATWIDGSITGIYGAQFVGDGTTNQTLDQAVVVTASVNIEHALIITVTNGPVKIRVGTAAGDDNYIEEATLETGEHNLAFTPAGDFNIRFFSSLLRAVSIGSCYISTSSVPYVAFASPWGDDIYSIRYDQSGDVIYLACSGNSGLYGNGGLGYQQYKIERRPNNSWSLVKFQSVDGPYRPENISPTTLTPSATSGNITVTASEPTFAATNVGCLYSMTTPGQNVTVSVTSAALTFTDPIVVTGVDEQRRFTTIVSGTFTATIVVQKSIGAPGSWVDVFSTTAPVNNSDKDGLDNQTIYYRIGAKAGGWTAGTAVCSLSYSNGTVIGVFRVTGFTDDQTVSAEVLDDLGIATATDVWAEGSWSDRRGWPSAVALYEGRLWWSGKNGIYGSTSDTFDTYAPAQDGFGGAADPINRTIGSGPVDDINWLLPLQRLIIGAEGTEFSARSTAFDEPLTPTNFNIKGATTQGSANVIPVKIDSRGAFVQRSGSRVYELSYSGESNDYAVNDLTALVPEVGQPSITWMAVQRQPDTRIHCVRSDGTVALLVQDKVENVLSWQLVETDGLVESVAVLPGAIEDQVYYSVNRDITKAVTSITPSTPPGLYGYYTVEDDTTNPLPSLTVIPNTPGVGDGATISINTWKIYAVRLNNKGTGYTAGDTLYAVGGTYSSPFAITVNTVNGSGVIVTYTQTPVSSGLYTDPRGAGTSFTGGTGTGAAITDDFPAGFRLAWSDDVEISNRGSGYVDGASVEVTGSLEDIEVEFTTYNPADKVANITLSGGDLTVTQTGTGIGRSVATITSGQWYWEVTVTTVGTMDIGMANSTEALANQGGSTNNSLSYRFTGQVVKNSFPVYAPTTYAYIAGDVIGVLYSPSVPSIAFYKNGTLVYTATGTDIPTGTLYAMIGATGGTTVSTTNFSSQTGVDTTVTATVSTIQSTTLEKWALESECVGGSFNKQADSFVSQTQSVSTTVSGLDHLAGRRVVVWADGVDLSPDDPDTGEQTTYLVSASGTITLDVQVANVVAGLPYSAQWKSTKLASMTDGKSWLNQRKGVSQLGLIMADVHSHGIKYGPDFDNLDPLPEVEQGTVVPYNTVWEQFDFDMMEFAGEWATDARICLEAKAPRPCTILAITIAVEEHGKS